MKKHMDNDFNCPECGRTLELADDHYVCQFCGFKIDEAIARGQELEDSDIETEAEQQI